MYLFTIRQEKRLKVKNYYFDLENYAIRTYFPVNSAIIKSNDKLTEASELGDVFLDKDNNIEDIQVIGRRKTDKISGVKSNIIRNDTIFLAKPRKVNHINKKKIYVFDFGKKVMMNHQSHHSMASTFSPFKGFMRLKTANAEDGEEQEEEGGVSCMSNHGGPNCSNAFGINNGRCTPTTSHCMYYNGWFINCQNGSYLNFPGSDCDTALGMGHCWNEL